MGNLQRRGLEAAKYTAIFKPLTQLGGVVALVLLVRVLPEQEFGVYNLLYSLIGLMGVVASFGLANTLQRYMPEYLNKGEYVLASHLYRASALVRLLSNVAVLGVLMAFWDALAPHLKITEYKDYFLVFTLIVLLDMQSRLVVVCLRAYFLHKYSQGFEALFMVLKGAGYVYLVIVRQMDLWSVILVDMASYCVYFGLLQWIYRKRIPQQGGRHQAMSRDEKKRVIKYAAFYNFNDAGSGVLDSRFDYFFIAAILDPVAVAAYAFCYRVSQIISRFMPVSYFLEVIRPALFASATRDGVDLDQMTRFFQVTLKVNYLFNLPVVFFIILVGEDLINVIFAGKYAEYALLLAGLYAFNTLNTFQIPVGLIAQLREKAAVIFFSKIFALYNILAALVLIHYWGIWGAVVATGSAIFLKNLFIWYFVRDEARFHGMSGYFARMLLYWALVYIVSYASVHGLANDHTRILVGTAIFAAAFAFQSRLRLFTKSEIKYLQGVIGRNRKANWLLKRLG